MVRSDPTLICESEVLKMVPVSARTLRRWVSSGHFPRPVRLGTDDERHGRKAWSLQEVLAWVQSRLHARETGAVT